MKMEELLSTREREQIFKTAEELALAFSIQWSEEITILLQTCINNPELSPRQINGNSTSEILKKWLIQYKNGYGNRPSVGHSKPPGTVPDHIIDLLIGCKLPQLSDADLEKLKYSHRLSMSAENILGNLLEEYLARQLSEFGWYCCWGSTVRSVDFCNSDGRLLQVKNRSNTENSSSIRVREGTNMQHWYRVNATTGMYNWEKLKDITGCQNLSENEFEEFTKEILQNNPAALPVEREDLYTNF